MLGLLLVMVVVTGIIIFVLLQTKTTTTTSKTSATKTTTITAVQTQKADNERKYIESLKVLSNLSESHRLQPYKPRLSITLNNFIVDKDFNVISPGCKAQIQKLAQFFDVYLLLLSSKEEENKAKSFLEEFKGIVPQHKALFCHSEDGLVAMIRQLKPRFHFENNGFVAEKLSQHLNHMIGLRDLQREINENSKKNAKWANILNHNVDFYDSFEDISSHVLQLMKFN